MIALATEAAAAEQASETEMRAVVAGLRTRLAIVESNEAALEDALAAANLRSQGVSVDELQLCDLQQAIEVKQELLVAFIEMWSGVELVRLWRIATYGLLARRCRLVRRIDPR